MIKNEIKSSGSYRSLEERMAELTHKMSMENKELSEKVENADSSEARPHSISPYINYGDSATLPNNNGNNDIMIQ